MIKALKYIFYCFLVIEILTYIIIENKLIPGLEIYSSKAEFSNYQDYNYPLGWDTNALGKSRKDLDYNDTCGSVYGDSFTYGSEVNDLETWPSQLSKLDNCRYFNNGVGGYGLDQVLLKLRTTQPEGKYVIIGIFSEMLRRNLAASWSYYANKPGSLLKPYFYKSEGIFKLMLPPEINQLTDTDISAYHQHDRYKKFYSLSFPYTFSIMNKIINQKKNYLSAEEVWDDAEATELSIHIIELITNEIRNYGKIPVFLFLTRSYNIYNGNIPYANYLTNEKIINKKLCILDPYFELKKAYLNDNQKLEMPEGHYNERGNSIIAKYISREITKCK